jgi:proline iminopeptidase
MVSGSYAEAVGGRFWYEVHGSLSAETPPLVVVHGGPGFPSFYLEPLRVLSNRIPVVFWDQAGCGRSKEFGERKDFSIEGFVSELEELRKALGVSKMHLYGHSFGGVIIGEYAIKFPQSVASTIFVSASLDIPRWRADAARLRKSLPLMSKMVLTEGDRTGNYTSPQYLAAYSEYINRFIYRFKEKPESISRSEIESDARTYMTMWGPNELVISGVVKDYSFSEQLPHLPAPALFMCGRYDEATPEAHEYFASQVPNALCVVFEESAHHPHINETEAVCKALATFLQLT